MYLNIGFQTASVALLGPYVPLLRPSRPPFCSKSRPRSVPKVFYRAFGRSRVLTASGQASWAPKRPLDRLPGPQKQLRAALLGALPLGPKTASGQGRSPNLSCGQSLCKHPASTARRPMSAGPSGATRLLRRRVFSHQGLSLRKVSKSLATKSLRYWCSEI